jgi:GNAT superfamily N-acetyltransferase
MEIDRNKIVVKKASTFDIDTIIEYRITFLKETYSIPSNELESNLRQSLKKYLTDSLNKDSFVSWIAEYENKPIAFGGMVIREQPGNFNIPYGRTGYILNMYTIKEFRSKGIGSLLFQKLIEEAKFRKLDRLELHATKDGEPIYRRFGFIEPHDKVLELILSK